MNSSFTEMNRLQYNMCCLRASGLNFLLPLDWIAVTPGVALIHHYMDDFSVTGTLTSTSKLCHYCIC